MSIIKITVLLRSPNVIWSYKKELNRDFWYDVSQYLKQEVAPLIPVETAQGSFLRNYYLSVKDKSIEYKGMTLDIIAKLLKKEDIANVIVTTSFPSEDELKGLMKADIDKNDNPEFWDEVIGFDNYDEFEFEDEDSGYPLEDDAELPTQEPKKAGEANKATIEQQDKAITRDNNAQNDNNDQQDKKPETLLDKAEKIKKLKDGLLDKIKGQRHAVDEVVQCIFECEMFASLNPNRKGPLATFLFTGPSGVGKTYLAEQCCKLLNKEMLIVDMSEYSDNLSNNKFNGEHGQPAVVTSFVRNHPDGIIIFDEIEKAHINTIHLFLQILDAARLMDHQTKKEVSFKNNIIIMTTNAGKELYDDPTVCDLSQTPRNVIIEALKNDKNPATNQPFFPECITTRMANGHIILFNHLEPFSLMEIVRDEIKLQIELFRQSSGIAVEYHPDLLSALILYNGGGLADARTLRGLAKNTIVRELQEMVMQIFSSNHDGVNSVKKISLTINTEGNEEIEKLFVNKQKMQVAVLSDKFPQSIRLEGNCQSTVFEIFTHPQPFKKRVRGVIDYLLIDPLCQEVCNSNTPNDIEDVNSEGMKMFNYVREFYPEIPVYILDTSSQNTNRSFDTLLARGAKGIIKLDLGDMTEFEATLEKLSFNALINNTVYGMGRSSKYLSFNCAQYIPSSDMAVISFEKYQIKKAYGASDSSSIAKKGENNNVKLCDVMGCKGAKQALSDYCKILDNPREVTLTGKRMPKGVLLYGPPGTGKTMLAKAMANQCDATFIPVSATSFFGSLVGETERNIRDLFKRARKYAPSIIFIDEVDAIGRLRVGSPSTSHNEDALNTFLAEMDGFVTDEKRPVFILAATNYQVDGEGGRVLDPAFVRRFDSRILVSLPDTEERYDYLINSLKKHGISFGESHHKVVSNMAERTGGMSYADLEILNSQYLRSLGDGEPDGAGYMDALDAFRFGEVNKMNEKHLRQTACHEAGHALVCRLCGSTPSFLTIVSRGNYGGFMESGQDDSSPTCTYDNLMDMVCRCLAGRIAEIELFGNSEGMNTGASSDIQKARYYVKASLNDFAMGENLYTPISDDQAEKLMRSQYQRTQDMIHSHKDILEKLTDLLALKKSLDKNQMEEFFANQNI